MKTARLSLLLTALLCLAPAFAAHAQRVVEGDLQKQMSAEEFKAAGLEKLSAQELAALNAWLQHKVVQETSKAVEVAKEEGRKEVKEKNRGFFDFGSNEPIESTLVGEFTGFGKGKKYTLQNGQVWEQIEPASLSGVRKTDVSVKIKPGVLGNWFMKIDGYNTQAKVRRIK